MRLNCLSPQELKYEEQTVPRVRLSSILATCSRWDWGWIHRASGPFPMKRIYKFKKRIRIKVDSKFGRCEFLLLSILFLLWYKKSRKWKFHFSPGIDKQKLEIKQFWLISLREEQPGIVDLEFPEEISFLSSNETFMRKASFCGQRGIRTITDFRYRIKRGNSCRSKILCFSFHP